MATRTGRTFVREDGSGSVEWTGLLTTDVGAGVSLARYADRTVQVIGTLGAGGSINLQGSNDNGVTWNTLGDCQGVAIATQGLGFKCVGDNPLLIRPSVVGGDGTTNITVIISFSVLF